MRMPRLFQSTTLVAATTVLAMYLAPLASGQTFTWTGATSTTWDTTASNWSGDGSIWVNGDTSDAVFSQGSNQATTLGAAITANNLSFSANGYSIAGSGSTLNLAGAGSAVDVSDGVSATLGMVIADAGTVGLTKTGNGTLIVSGANTYSGPTTITGGVLTLMAAGNFTAGAGGVASPLGASSSAAANLVLDGGTLRAGSINGLRFIDRQFTLGQNGGILDSGGSASAMQFISTGSVAYSNPGTDRILTLTGDNAISTSILVLSIGDAGAGKVGITKTGGGVWELEGSSNTYSGPTSVQSGTLDLSSVAGNANSAFTVSSGAILQVNGGGVMALGSLAGAGIVEGSRNSQPLLTVGGDGTNTEFSGIIRDGSGGFGLSLTKVGAGTLTLTGTANIYTRSTTITSGKLVLGASGSLPASSAVKMNGGILAIADGTTNGLATGGTLTLLADSIIDFSDPTLTSTLSFADSAGVAWTDGTILDITGYNSNSHLFAGSSLSGLTSDQLGQILFNGTLPAGILSTGEVVPVPEPGSVLVLAAALLGLARRGRRRPTDPA